MSDARFTAWDRQGQGLAVLGTAAFNGLAFDAYQTWAFWRAEAVGHAASPFRAPDGEKLTMVHARSLPPQLFGRARLERLLAPCFDELAPTLAPWGPKARLGVALAVSERLGPTSTPALREERARLEQFVQRSFAERGWPAPVVAIVPRGHAGLAFALEEAAPALENRLIDVLLVGGVDSYYDPTLVDELVRDQRIFDQQNVDSLIPGEGAALLAFASVTEARARRLELQARVLASATALEPVSLETTLRNPEAPPSLATGLTEALTPVLAHLARRGAPLHWVLGDVNNESYRAREYQLAMPRATAPGGLDDGGKSFLPVVPDDVAQDFLPLRFGDLGAATMPTAAVLACESFRRGHPTRERALLMGSSFGPPRGAVALVAERGARPAT